MRYLLDTCVLSELRKPKGSTTVKKTIEKIPSENLFISVVSIGEIAKGIALLDDGKHKHDLESWLQGIEHFYNQKILEIDTETSRIWGELIASARQKGKAVPAIDGLIAATAHRHGLHLMTRNVSDFEPTGVLLINPWE